MLDRLKLVKDQIGFPAFWNEPADVIVEGEAVRKLPVAQGFQIHVNDMILRYPIVRQILVEQVQQG